MSTQTPRRGEECRGKSGHPPIGWNLENCDQHAIRLDDFLNLEFERDGVPVGQSYLLAFDTPCHCAVPLMGIRIKLRQHDPHLRPLGRRRPNRHRAQRVVIGRRQEEQEPPSVFSKNCVVQHATNPAASGPVRPASQSICSNRAFTSGPLSGTEVEMRTFASTSGGSAC
ncbi:MAG: hypothetical protein JWM97_2154 [Phycisphaerales bacterium]|nr:hypothetical protein [Phycisphaerales bacterium]